MNYLAHIHLAHISQTSKLGNFLGDFVKGSQLQTYSPGLQTGIRLHRRIDGYTDNHPAVRALKQQFPADLRRMAGVVIDIFFDHLLCQHWQAFTEHELDSVLDEFYRELQVTDIHVSDRYSQVKQGLINYQWLTDYHKFDAVIRAFKQIEKRINHKVIFADAAKSLLNNEHERFESAFLTLYPDLIEFVLKDARSHWHVP